jgi:ABC-type polysaccharide/polyol phosphate transport system ATPase subunit
MTAIKFDHVSKAYDLYSGNRTIISSLRLVMNTNRDKKSFYAVSDVSFEIEKGEAYGIIGKNGAGKSTILKIIAGITKPTSGYTQVNGLVSSLIELGAGFHPDLTGRENIFMCAAILGIPRKVIESRFEEIVNFAELWDFIDVPVKKYSSGMYARLGFAVAVNVDPEILIIDEILAVGDIFFQQKCFTKIREIIGRGVTFIFVTHDPAALQNLCKRALLLDNGKVDYIGDATEAVSRYFAKVGSRPQRAESMHQKMRLIDTGLGKISMSREEIIENSILRNNHPRHGAQGMEVIAARITNVSGKDTMQVPIMGSLNITVLLKANEDVVDPSSGIHLYDRMGNLVFAAGTRQLHHRLPDLDTGMEFIVSFKITMSVGPGEYTFSIGCSEPSPEGPNYGYIQDRREMLGPLVVIGDHTKVFPFYGIAQLPMEISMLKLEGQGLKP